MVELVDVDRLPIDEIVALQAIRSQCAFVLILMASSAGLGHTQESVIQIFDLDRCSLGRRNSRRSVTLVAGQASMPAFKGISGLPVIECFYVPLDQRKVCAVMVRMAARAFLA